MRQTVLFLTLCAAVSGQSMLEGGAIAAGTAIGSAAGKKVSDGINANLKKTGKVLDKAAKTGPEKAKTTAATRSPMLQVGAGVPKAEANNVPPPPPKRRAAPSTAQARPVRVPMVMSAVIPAPPKPPLNVDLAAIQNGTPRDAVLELGDPSARITMYQDGHLVEIYQYRNHSLASGTVRLRDGAVASVEARP